jgi:hypothetical protein
MDAVTSMLRGAVTQDLDGNQTPAKATIFGMHAWDCPWLMGGKDA